jgi:small basic protein
MNAVIHDTLGFLIHFSACVVVLGMVVFVNYAFSRDKVISHTMRHNNSN